MTIALDRTSDNHAKDRVAEFVANLKSQGIKQVRFEFSDLHGVSRSKLVPIEAVEGFLTPVSTFMVGSWVLILPHILSLRPDSMKI